MEFSRKNKPVTRLFGVARPRGKSLMGFTLVELLVVVAVISLLSSVVFAGLQSARKKARDAQRLSDMKQIQLALELFYDSYGWYPGTISQAGSVGLYGETATCSWDSSSYDQEVEVGDRDGKPFIEPLIDAGFFSSVPLDPLTPSLNDCNGYTYKYYRYPAGSYGCDASRGAFYVLGVRDMETSDRPHPSSPGWSCPPPNRNWQLEFDWVTGSFEK